MAKKIKEPPFADWRIVLGSDGGYSETLTVRATSLAVIDATTYLQDIRGGVLFIAPSANVRYVRRLEPGVDVPAAKEEPKAAETASSAPASGPPLTGPPPTASQSVTVAGTGPRPRSTRRAK
jgi:hypothetical protein